MKAVVMAGGEGTRLRPLTSNQPKPMVPIVGKPCMEHALDLLRAHGLTEIVVTLAFMPQAIRTYFGDGESLGLEMDYSVEEQPLGTAGSVGLAKERLTDTFLVISGDALCDVDLTALVEAHRAKGAAVTIGLKSVDNPLEFGIVVTDDDGRVERFLEKPSWGQVFSDTINTGIYVLEPEVLRHVPDDRPYDFSKELFPHLLEMGRPIYGHVLDGYWQDVGTLEQYRQANFDALDGAVQLEIPGLRLRGNVWVSEEVDIDQLEPVVGPAFIGVNSRIADAASVGAYSVLTRGVIVREGARVTRTVIDAGTYLGRSAVVEGAIIGRSCDVRDHVRIHEGVAIGDEVTIGPEASIFPGVRIYPFKEIETGAQIHESIIWEKRASKSAFGRDGAAPREPRGRQPSLLRRVPDDPAGDHRRPHLDGRPRRRPPDLAGGGHAARPEDAGSRGRRARGPLQRRSRGDRGPRLRVAGDPDDRRPAEGGREALRPPRAAPRDVRRGRGDDLPGPRSRELCPGHPRRHRPRADPRPAVPDRDRLRPFRRDVHAPPPARPSGRGGDRDAGVLRRRRPLRARAA
ncbi:MAG TPA: sugar phosphate nucleotidyltransferase, partial [Gaiella sp.]|nr:sugar phosphate nucleotidyltransferase [Gaiella sp.]